MRARDLAAPYPTVGLSTSALDAARQLADANLPGLIVVDAAGRPSTILPGTQVLRLAVPKYCQENVALARVIDEAHADEFLRDLADRTVAECLPKPERELAIVGPDATVLEIAALMARTRSPLVAVVDGHTTLGAVTLDALLDRMLAS
ncbi:CBS domain-containing protein [Luedemannella helvata]|uniref:CBS domain-containing protein n=1 Tax=Luedemannella helvata TaxID=349315 RepID=A0ABP4XEX3_9ACTN